MTIRRKTSQEARAGTCARAVASGLAGRKSGGKDGGYVDVVAQALSEGRSRGSVPSLCQERRSGAMIARERGTSMTMAMALMVLRTMRTSKRKLMTDA